MAEPHYLGGGAMLPGTVASVDDHFFRRYRTLLDAEDAAFDELEHAYEDGDRASGQREELRDDRRDAVEVSGAVRALEHGREALHAHAGPEALGVHRGALGRKDGVHARRPAALEVRLERPRVAREVLVRPELERVHEDRERDPARTATPSLVHQREVPVARVLVGDGFTLELKGRLDGLVSTAEPPWIEEIKTVTAGWTGEADPLHWAQAKLYAALLLDSLAAGRLDDIPQDSERAFLIGTARRVAHTLGRKTLRWQLSEDMDERISSARDAGDEHADLQLFDIALSKMNPELSEAFVLYEVEGLSSPEIAALLEIPLGSVASRLRRAREQFRDAATRIGKVLQRIAGRP